MGQSQYAVVEADESDASFLELKPYYAVVTNIEDDHLDFYRSVDNIHKAFNKYIDGVKTGGLAVVYGEDESIKVIADMTPTRLVTYGEAENNDYYFRNWTAAGMGSVFEIYHNRKLLGQVELSIPGRHNALNATSAVAVAMEMGLDFAAVSRAIKEFHGAKRRFEVIGQEKNITVVDDYAHHPTEIQATIEAARSYQSQGRVVVLFQPHRYSRTQLLGKQLGEALAAADLVVVTDVYSAGENKIPGIDGSLVEKAARHAGASSVYCSSWQEAEKYLISEIRNNDLIITMGAGDIWKMGPQLLEKCQCSV
ncbi:UDP-N-acetylmuramate--L-alanine ligase [Syntrophomonas palmitatica]|uniref:UDP-N-acetylmuramate--L-alanine ligase n=1 Tax=Syntrophomonas palmitatica TaxID=402877 RepID=UPI001FA76C42|nr:Mur ligase family protein [Syntrophomonas palmitatica]